MTAVPPILPLHRRESEGGYERGSSKTLLPDEAGARDYGVAGGVLVVDLVVCPGGFFVYYAGGFRHLVFYLGHFFVQVQGWFHGGGGLPPIAQRAAYVV